MKKWILALFLCALPCAAQISPPPPGAQKIASVTVAGTATTAVTFSAIPQGFSSLWIVTSGSTSDALTSASIYCEFNGDTTAANYGGYYFIAGQGTAGSAGALGTGTLGVQCLNIAATAWTSVKSQGNLLIASYTDAFTKSGQGTGEYPSATTFGAVNSQVFSFNWNSTAAITAITLTDQGGGHFLAGTIFTLYGLR